MAVRLVLACLLFVSLASAQKLAPKESEKIKVNKSDHFDVSLAGQLPAKPFVVKMNSKTRNDWQEQRFMAPSAKPASQHVFVFEVDDALPDREVNVRLAKVKVK